MFETKRKADFASKSSILGLTFKGMLQAGIHQVLSHRALRRSNLKGLLKVF